ncbi:MAG: D-sedoheptulose 7-phosphate isomerase [Candidatus Micrarchaeota archaeon]|nr:D-sedoheptulose 7-phosphate isomerase [Candidatus Micrarchaeota archaeon]
MENGLLREAAGAHIEAMKKLQSDAALGMAAEKLASKTAHAFKNGGKLLVFGNGGSAADAQHMAAEFVGRYLKERRALPAIALTANTSALTAIGNDYGFERVFARQVSALAGKNDVVVGISTSGNSPNVILALEAAKANGAFTAALVGGKACRMDSAADLVLKAPSESTPRIQEMHILIIHTVCGMVETELFG